MLPVGAWLAIIPNRAPASLESPVIRISNFKTFVAQSLPQAVNPNFLSRGNVTRLITVFNLGSGPRLISAVNSTGMGQPTFRPSALLGFGPIGVVHCKY